MKLVITAVNGGTADGHQEIRFRSEDGRANGALNLYNPEEFTQASQGDAIDFDINDSGYDEPATSGAGATMTTTDAAAGQPVATEQPASVVVAQPAVPAQPTRRRGSQQ